MSYIAIMLFLDSYTFLYLVIQIWITIISSQVDMRAELEIARSIKSTTGVNPDLWMTVASRLTLLTKITVCDNSRVIVCILRGFNRALPFRERMTPRYFAKTEHRDAHITVCNKFRLSIISSSPLHNAFFTPYNSEAQIHALYAT